MTEEQWRDLIARAGVEDVVAQVGLENVVAQLSDEQRQQLVDLLQEPPAPPEGKRKRK
jgi:hypothetical protein